MPLTFPTIPTRILAAVRDAIAQIDDPQSAGTLLFRSVHLAEQGLGEEIPIALVRFTRSSARQTSVGPDSTARLTIESTIEVMIDIEADEAPTDRQAVVAGAVIDAIHADRSLGGIATDVVVQDPGFELGQAAEAVGDARLRFAMTFDCTFRVQASDMGVAV